MKTKRGWEESNSLAVQWLGLRTLTAEAPGSIPGWGTKIPQASRSKKNEVRKKLLGTRENSDYEEL